MSRRALSREVCQWLDWRGADGQLKQMSARVALKRLDEAGVIELPSAAPGPRPSAKVELGPNQCARSVSMSLRVLT